MADNRPGGSIHFLLFSNKTVFFKLKDIFPECFVNRDPTPLAEPLMCLQQTCPTNHNCMEILAKRIHVLFTEVLPQVDLIVLYFRFRAFDSIGAGLFWKSMEEPRVITMNPHAWTYVKERGFVFEFTPGPSFYLTGKAATPELSSEKSVLEVGHDSVQ